MLVLKNSGIDLTKSETRTLLAFSLLYSFLVLVILSVVTFLYYQFQKDLMLQEKRQILQNYSNDLFDLNSIVVFTKKGCSRSKKTIDYLNFNNIKFIELNTTDNKENAEIMWKKINLTKPISITYPVIVINNKLTHSHKDLDLFLKQIK